MTHLQGQQTKKPGLCFVCHGEGQWKSDCPTAKAVNTSNNKISSYTESLAYKAIRSISHPKEQVHVHITGSESDTCKGTSEGDLEPSPVGRLQKAIDKWKEITDDRYILEVIRQGYSLPLKENPKTIILKNNKSARSNMSFVTQEVNNLVERGVVSEVPEAPKVVNPLTVAYNKIGKPRLVLDCRHINSCLHVFKFKYEDIKVAESMFETGSFLFTFDLKSAYHSVDILPKHRTLLGFAVQDGGKMKWYVFNSLPFGIASAGHIFTKVLRVVVAFWRSRGHKVIMFLDDGVGGARGLDEAVRSSNFVRETLLSLGFLLASEKCHWQPCQQVTWLGHFLDMKEAKLYITEERIKRLETAIDSMIYQIDKDQYNLIHVKVLASVVGQIISLQNVVGTKVRLLTRHMYKCILSKASWNAPVVITTEARAELNFWKTNVRGINSHGKSINGKSFYQLCLFTDASSSGYGGYVQAYGNAEFGSLESLRPECKSPEVDCSKFPEVDIKMFPEIGNERSTKIECMGNLHTDVECAMGKSMRPPEEGSIMLPEASISESLEKESNGFQTMTSNGMGSGRHVFRKKRAVSGVVFGDWTEEEKSKSSTWRESETVRRVIMSNVDMLKNKKVKIYSDNKNVQSVLQIGSRKTDLQEIACDVNDMCEKYEMKICPEWIPRSQNEVADDLSRWGDCEDWSISDQIFTDLNLKWGPHTFDRFASQYNSKCMKFNSRFWVPGTQGINGLDQFWGGENNWIVPPPRLILDSVRKIENESANCTLIIPVWRSATYWPELLDKNCSFKSFVNDFIILPPRNVILKGRGNNGIFGKEQLSFRMAALKIRF
ncbi:MAG: reverse transcriptase domain-containing protein [Candidatus Thiodiazotropha endolucinida]|nr:hypothetical protein [Candidatus Thiodiazotropha taylori]MCW4260820.1 reverse transcriptase domain-containing protein [Candidatus Thiodiazotropha endolucinida]